MSTQSTNLGNGEVLVQYLPSSFATDMTYALFPSLHELFELIRAQSIVGISIVGGGIADFEVLVLNNSKPLNMRIGQEEIGEDMPSTYLKDWFVRFLRNRDLFFKKIKEMKEEGNRVEVVADKTIVYLIEPFLEDMCKAIEGLKAENKGLVVYNTVDNFKQLTKSWGKLVKEKSLMIYFVNPFSKTDKRWVINPKTHAMISDEESLREGLNSMFVTVDTVTRKEVEKIVG